jgi:hypothetical protein
LYCRLDTTQTSPSLSYGRRFSNCNNWLFQNFPTKLKKKKQRKEAKEIFAKARWKGEKINR